MTKLGAPEKVFSLWEHRGTYLWVLQAGEVRVQVELDALASPWQGHTTNQQHNEHDKWECGCDVDHLRETTTQKPKSNTDKLPEQFDVVV